MSLCELEFGIAKFCLKVICTFGLAHTHTFERDVESIIICSAHMAYAYGKFIPAVGICHVG
jgi:hypothetical protein